MSPTPKHYLCVSSPTRPSPAAVAANILTALRRNAITLGEAADTLFEVTTMPAVAHPILDATMSPDQDSNKEQKV